MRLDNSPFRDVPLNKGEDIVLFFSPDALILPHFAAQCVLARTLQDRGYRPLLVRCSADFDRCPAMDMVSAPYDIDEALKRKAFCEQCSTAFEYVAASYDLPFLRLSRVITPQMREEAARIANDAAGNPPELLHEFSKIGKLCGIDFALIQKHGDLSSLSDEQKAIWTIYNRNCLLAYFAVDKLCENLPVKRICVFNIYSLLMAAGLVAKKRKLPLINTTMAAHLSIDYRRYIILPQAFTNEVKKSMIRDWYRWRDIAIEPHIFSEVSTDLLSKQRGSGAQHYSPARSGESSDLYQRLNLSRDRKLLVAYPSSVDELVSIQLLGEAFDQPFVLEGNAFATQVEWLEELVRYTEASSDLQLVIRIHPREAANKRESVSSLQLGMLRQALSGEYRHCRVVWPQDDISSYDLAEIADLGLTSWSSMGLEFARLGIPALTCARFVTFADDDFLRWGGETPEDYFAELRRMLDSEPSPEKIRRAFRAYHYAQLSHSVLLDDVVPHAGFMDVAPYTLPREAATIEDVFVNGSKLTTYNRRRLLLRDQEEASELEARELTRHLRRTAHYYLTGELCADDHEILVVESEMPTAESAIIEHADGVLARSALLIVSTASRSVVYVHDGKRIERFSPLVARLAKLLTTEKSGAERPPRSSEAPSLFSRTAHVSHAAPPKTVQ